MGDRSVSLFAYLFDFNRFGRSEAAQMMHIFLQPVNGVNDGWLWIYVGHASMFMTLIASMHLGLLHSHNVNIVFDIIESNKKWDGSMGENNSILIWRKSFSSAKTEFILAILSMELSWKWK